MKLNLPDVTNVSQLATINSNFDAIADELQNKVLYRDNPDGEDNTVKKDIDVNGKGLYNAGTVSTQELYINGKRVIPVGGLVESGSVDPASVLYKANNLSDVQSPSASRNNLGLGNVNNTSDASKPVSAPVASALASKQDTLVSGSNIKTINGSSIVGSGNLVISGGGGGGAGALIDTNNLSDVQSAATSRINLGLGNVDNTSDVNKPLSTATTTALVNKQNTLVSGSNIKTVNGNSILGVGNISAGSPWISVMDFGADATGVANSSTAFQSAIAALPATGGRIIVPYGTFLLNTEPNIGTKSVYWDIDVAALFTGSGATIGKFPYVSTVGGQKSVGPLIKSQSMVNVGNPNGGIAAFQIDMLQPAAYGAGNSLAAYLGAQSSNTNTGGNIWALNTMIKCESGYAGTAQCIEVDADVFTNAASALIKGISISGTGTNGYSADVGVEITRVPGTVWDRGIDILEATMGIQIRASCSGGISINAPAQTLNTPIGAKQRVSGGDTVVLQRTNDAVPGTFLRGTNASNTVNLFEINGAGDAFFQNGTFNGYVQINNQLGVHNVYIANQAAAGPAGVLNIGNQTFGSAGSISKYLEVFIGSTPYKIPLYTF